MSFRRVEQTTKHASCRVVILMDRRWHDRIQNYVFVSERIIIDKLQFDWEILLCVCIRAEVIERGRVWEVL